VAEALIRQRVEDMVKALRAKDIDAVMSLYAPNMVSFDIVPPLRYVGADHKRRAWQEVFAVFTGPVRLRGTRLERHDTRRLGLRS
jgi:ketosteroid isomerase-like protein